MLLATGVMLAAILLLHFTCLHFFPKPELDPAQLSDFYPLSVFVARVPKPYQLLSAALYGLFFVHAWRAWSKSQSTWLVVAVGLGFAVLSNCLHGFRNGLDFPTATRGDTGIEYYHDALAIPGALWLLENFNAVQLLLLEHSRTHPPGPVLFYWSLWRVLRYPAAISVAVCGTSLALAVPFLKRLVRLTLGEAPSGALLLFTLLPSVLVYGLATADAFIAALFLAALVAFIDDESPTSIWLAALFLFASLMFTFGSLVLLPVLLGFELLRRRRATRFAQVLGGAIALLVLVRWGFGFNWWQAFRIASSIENRHGFLLLADPRRYLWYRLGAVAEICFFFSPYMAHLWWRGRARLRELSQDGYALAWLGPASLACFLLSGALRIGEAARVCLFILPYLALPAYAAWKDVEDAAKFRVASALWAFGALLQLFGFYQW